VFATAVSYSEAGGELEFAVPCSVSYSPGVQTCQLPPRAARCEDLRAPLPFVISTSAFSHPVILHIQDVS